MRTPLEARTDLEHHDPSIVVVFHTGEIDVQNEEYLAWMEVSELPPLPSEGNVVKLGEGFGEFDEETEEVNFEVPDTSEYRVVDVSYDYLLSEYPVFEENDPTGETATKWYMYVNIEVESID